MRSKAFIIFCLCALLCVQAKAQTDSTNCPRDTVNGEIVYRYEVEKSIGLYRIGVKFGVPQSEIVRMNPELKERGLRFGETLLIPTGKKAVKPKKEIRELPQVRKPEITKDVKTPVEVEAKIVEESVVADTLAADSTATDSVIVREKRLVELAVMLPFESGQAKQSQNAERIMAFYQGVLLAMNDSQNDSLKYRLRVYDTGRSERVVNHLCDSTELDSVQAILGLAYPIQVERVAEWCRSKNVPLLVPFISDIDIARQANVLQFNSSDRQSADSICAWIRAHENLHCVLVETNESETATSIAILRDEMKARKIAFRRVPVTDLQNDSAGYALDSTKENLIILPSDRYQQIRMLLPRLEVLRDAGYRIRLLSQYSWQKERIGLPMIYTSVFTANADRTAYQQLWDRYYAGEFVTETPRYDLLGYDLTKALLGWLQGRTHHDGLQSVIDWQRVGNGGWLNGGMRVVEK